MPVTSIKKVALTTRDLIQLTHALVG